MTDREKAAVRAVIRTLNSVQVQGYENMNRVLACASALQGLLEEGGNGTDNDTGGD